MRVEWSQCGLNEVHYVASAKVGNRRARMHASLLRGSFYQKPWCWYVNGLDDLGADSIGYADTGEEARVAAEEFLRGLQVAA